MPAQDQGVQLVAGMFLLVAMASVASADVTLPAVFADHMVLERDRALPVWGWADPGERVGVTFAGQTRLVTADASGGWSVRLAAIEAGGPYMISVQGNNTIRIRDVLVGEVWIASGQSNMAMTVDRVANAQAEIAAAQYPAIRMFSVARFAAETPQQNCQGRWEVCGPATVSRFSATAYYFGRQLHETLKLPVGLINSSWGGTPIEAWTSIQTQRDIPAIRSRLKEWCRSGVRGDAPSSAAEFARWRKAATQAQAAGKPLPPRPRRPQQRPGTLYNGMIAPLVPYAIRGVIWYQGEHNAIFGPARIYGTQLATLIGDWRSRWGQGDFQFLFVQLPNYCVLREQPIEPDGWVQVREEMLKTLSVPGTGMAVTIDIGDPNDIHPKNKQEVGRRLALWALAGTYGQDVVRSGPLLKSASRQADKMVLQFNYVGGGLVAEGGQPLRGFVITGADRRFVPATARIDGSEVVVSSPQVSEPVAVRYAWTNNPNGNLFNRAGLPASPFRTDAWP